MSEKQSLNPFPEGFDASSLEALKEYHYEQRRLAQEKVDEANAVYTYWDQLLKASRSLHLETLTKPNQSKL